MITSINTIKNRLRIEEASYSLLSWLFLRGLALIYFAAFASLSLQIKGLVGAEGISPVSSWLAGIKSLYPGDWLGLFPTLLWFDASDDALQWLCLAGMAAALFLLLNIADIASLLLCYLCYLSVTVAGQDFTAFQWDYFLLEAGFLGIFLKLGSPIAVYLYRWLLARFMLMGGIVKLASGDPTWTDLTALSFHYQTQPLPTPLAYYAYHLPLWFHKLCTAGVFFAELIVPFFVFLPRPFRLFAAGSFIALQSAIILTGNFNFFNLLTLLLCVLLFDERDVTSLLPSRWVALMTRKKDKPSLLAHVLAGCWAMLVLSVNASSIWTYHAQERPARPLVRVMQIVTAWGLVNNYGPFAVMTTERNEIIVQGSDDNKNWRTYHFNYKPVRLDQPLTWNIPHQPRLDWQMWFAALQRPSTHSWFARFMRRLKQGSPQVLALLQNNPFPEHPPAFLRALLYRYEFTSPTERARTGNVWRRNYVGIYWSST